MGINITCSRISNLYITYLNPRFIDLNKYRDLLVVQKNGKEVARVTFVKTVNGKGNIFVFCLILWILCWSMLCIYCSTTPVLCNYHTMLCM